jgi:hypothetical protein
MPTIKLGNRAGAVALVVWDGMGTDLLSRYATRRGSEKLRI